MLKPFRIVHYPLFIAIILLFFFVILNLSSHKPRLLSKDRFGIISEYTADAGSNQKYSDGRSGTELNLNNKRGTVYFSNRGLRNPFKTENHIRDNIRLQGGFKGKSLFPGLRIVHLDLKGAPPKVSYLVKIFPILADLGANGLLMEYEDMFPYGKGNYVAGNAYTKAEIAELLKVAKQNKLEVIPLLQTFGHAEFVLKLKEYKHLRENPAYPQAYCPSKNESLLLIESLIDSVLDTHPDSKYFHIGCDEVFQLGDCSLCKQAMQENSWTKRQLFLNHVRTVAQYVNTHYPKVQVLIWDDELRDLSIAELQDSGLGSLVLPVVWKYSTEVSSQFPPFFWTKYSTVFKKVWIASAFKGADRSDAVTLNLDIYMSNHESWMETVVSNSKYVDFAGMILTGWQRYDHFAVLCELLPVAFPSLAVNLMYLAGSEASIERVSEKVKDLLNCDIPLLFNPINRLTNHCGFPGAGIYEAVSLLPSILSDIRDMKQSSAFRGWFTKYNINKRFSSPYLVSQATLNLELLINELTSLEVKLIETMEDVYDKFTVEEWLNIHLRPHQEEMQALKKARSSLFFLDDWPKRPLHDTKDSTSTLTSQ